MEDARAYILEDATSTGKKIEKYMEDAVELYHKWGADTLLVESNGAGSLWELAVPDMVNLHLEHVSISKEARARSIVPLYTKNRVSHVGHGLSDLEQEMVAFDPNLIRKQKSPGRMDSVSNGLRYLFEPLLKGGRIKDLDIQSMTISSSASRNDFTLNIEETHTYSPFADLMDQQLSESTSESGWDFNLLSLS
ncbi:hypothetical protein [Endozoicomonas sp. ALB115]|uniref:hypothetical protein n=1 Tax=Endozoicomonas sp. ALB115 TaxID=3403074 RepID=UPI003BB62281